MQNTYYELPPALQGEDEVHAKPTQNKCLVDYGLNNLNEFLHTVHVYENTLYDSCPCKIYFLIDTVWLVASSLFDICP